MMDADDPVIGMTGEGGRSPEPNASQCAEGVSRADGRSEVVEPNPTGSETPTATSPNPRHPGYRTKEWWDGLIAMIRRA